MHNRNNKTLRQDRSVAKETIASTKMALKAISVSIKKKTQASILATLIVPIAVETLNKNTAQSHQRELRKSINSLQVLKR